MPKLTLSSPVLEFGEVYLRHPYKRVVRLVNDSKLPAKYEVLPQDPQVWGDGVVTHKHTPC